MNAQEALEAFLTPPRSPEFSRETKLLSQAVTSRVLLGPNGFARGGDAEIQVYSWGEGPTVLFVHGWGGNAGNNYAGIEAILQGGGRAVAFDAPAHGVPVASFLALRPLRGPSKGSPDMSEVYRGLSPTPSAGPRFVSPCAEECKPRAPC